MYFVDLAVDFHCILKIESYWKLKLIMVLNHLTPDHSDREFHTS